MCAPAQDQLDVSLGSHGLRRVVHQEPFFSDPADAPKRPIHLAGLEFRIPTSAVAELLAFGDKGRPPWQKRIAAGALHLAACAQVSKFQGICAAQGLQLLA